jgi:glycosyltransferase involved in cell wall biosynthesis
VSQLENRVPDLSLVMPCYQEEDCIGETAPHLTRTFERAGVDLDLVMVDNGSTDRTGQIIDDLIASGLPIRKVRVDVNRGYSNGILRGFEVCTAAPVVGHVCADGQVSPEDVLRTYRLMAEREERIVAKVRRRFRQDDWRRKVVSFIYNLGIHGIYGWLGAIDINGTPKMYSRRNLERMRLASRDWFLDPEIMIKAKVMGLRIIEIDVEGRARQGGRSHIRVNTLTEFVRNIFGYRFGRAFRDFRHRIRQERAGDAEAGRAIAASPDLLAKVRVIEHEPETESGRALLPASHLGGGFPSGAVRLATLAPGDTFGDCVYQRTGLWLSLVQGAGALYLLHPATGQRRTLELEAKRPVSVYVPAGVAHAVVNRSTGPALCMIWADAHHGDGDRHPLSVAAQPLVAAD